MKEIWKLNNCWIGYMPWKNNLITKISKKKIW
jgi:hypothetical protein